MAKNYFLLIALFLSFQTVLSQKRISKNKEMSLKVSVLDKKTRNTIKNVDIQVNGISFPFVNIDDSYTIKAKIGDQLKVDHPDFEMVYYTINSNDDINILVEDFEKSSSIGYLSESLNSSSNLYYQYLDLSNFTRRKTLKRAFLL